MKRSVSAKSSVNCEPGETLTALVNHDGSLQAQAKWDGNGGVKIRGRGKDGLPWQLEFHALGGNRFEVVKVEGSVEGEFRTLSPSSTGMKYTTECVLKEIRG